MYCSGTGSPGAGDSRGLGVDEPSRYPHESESLNCVRPACPTPSGSRLLGHKRAITSLADALSVGFCCAMPSSSGICTPASTTSRNASTSPLRTRSSSDSLPQETAIVTKSDHTSCLGPSGYDLLNVSGALYTATAAGVGEAACWQGGGGASYVPSA